MRLILVKILANSLIVVLPMFGALFGYVVGAFLRLGSRWQFRLINGCSILLAPTPIVLAGEFQLAPASFALIRGLLSGPLLAVLVASGTSMVCLTFVNIRISKYIKR